MAGTPGMTEETALLSLVRRARRRKATSP
jgi:hypothetical protein